MNEESFDALSPDRTIAGIVPRPNATITSAPAAASVVVADSNKAL